MRRQCELLHVARSVLYYKSVGESESERRMMRALDEIYMIDPCMGSRRLVGKLSEGYGIETSRKQVQRLRREMGIETIWCRPRRTSTPDNGHRKYPYLLKGREIKKADEVWCADITYIPMPPGQGHSYLCAVIIVLGSMSFVNFPAENRDFPSMSQKFLLIINGLWKIQAVSSYKSLSSFSSGSVIFVE